MTQKNNAFTLVELLVVMAVIAILAGLILGTAGYIQRHAASQRALGEIQALEQAIEAFKNDNAAYPEDNLSYTPFTSNSTDNLNAKTQGNPAGDGNAYSKASLVLYERLSGDTNNDGVPASGSGDYVNGVEPKIYMTFKPDMCGRSNPTVAIAAGTNPVTSLIDPFGNSYGYSTIQLYKQSQANPPGTADVTNYGFNPTYDLWSTAGNSQDPTGNYAPGKTQDVTQAWIKNW